ncbi:MAG: hypothetical protein L6R38_001462 [Xanthoria sp. 2 TBL-2021]|nr:MAG: hypothetical protein L6R38_001462 [Xanthoria sp. 2 TBL-2021]
MDYSLPLELHHHIFALVDRSDVPNLREVCKTFANVGLDYLLPEVEITFTRKSFEHLAEVVKHPILGRRVKSLVYHIDVLKTHYSSGEWMRGIGGALYMGNPKACSPKLRYTEKELAIGYATYEKTRAEQEDLRQKDFGIVDIMTMVAQLPNLKRITLSNFLGACTESSIVEETFEDTFVGAFGDDHHYNHCGVPQLLTLLHGVRSATATITLENFNMGLVSWKILQESDENFELMREIFRPLKGFRMALCTSQIYGWRDPDARDDERVLEGDAECQAFLDKGRHLALLQSMSNLQILDLTFHSKELGDFDLVSTFRDSYWPNLREVNLQFYYSTDKDLLGFLYKHIKTLKVVHVVHYRLIRGLWLAVFRDLRTTLHLEKFRCGGFLSNDTMEGDYWDFCGYPKRPIPIRDLVAAYVLGEENTTAEDVLKIANAQKHHETLPPQHV